MSRRSFLRYAGLGVGLVAAGGLGSLLSACAPPTEARPRPDSAANTDRGLAPSVVLSMRAEPDLIQILPGPATNVWRYRAEVIQGRKDAVRSIPGSYLGPILHFQYGERVRIDFTNGLPEPTVVHWHGLHVPEAADGHPRLAIDPGESYTYEFTVRNRAGTYWYHPHPHGRTGPQVYRGLAGLLVVTDDEEAGISLPNGAYDVPMVIQDRKVTSDNQLAYDVQGMHDRIAGFLGDRIFVNGQPDFSLPAEPRAYRFRILNGSNSRIYKLAWSDGRPVTVIATDGGLLERPVERSYVMLSPGERIELWADFAVDPARTALTLQNLDYAGNVVFPIARVVVSEGSGSPAQLPARLSTIDWHNLGDAVNQGRPRRFELAFKRRQWHLNGRTFEMTDVARNEIVRLGDLEVWEFVNDTAHMAMPHPMHVHQVQFQVIERQVLANYADLHASVSNGYIDQGWQDTVLLMPGERVKLLVRFEDYEGLFLYHCHNLEHEDMGMMRNFRIKA